MTEKNPFEVLGIAPSVLRGLRNEQARQLVKSMQRGLQAIHHPDRGGKAEKMVAINNAVMMLEDERAFTDFKRKYLASTPMQKKIGELELTLQQSDRTVIAMYDAALLSLNCAFGIDARPNVFTCDRMYVRELVEAKNGQRHLGPAHSVRLRETDEYSGLIQKGEVYRLSIASGVPTQTLFVRKNRREPVHVAETRVLPHKRMMGTISDTDILALNGYDGIVALLSGGTPVPSTRHLTSSTTRSMSPGLFANKVTLQQFRTIYPYISPVIQVDGFLFAMNFPPGEDAFISLDGRVMRHVAWLENA